MKLSDLLIYDNIVVQCHDFPDADAISSGFAVYTYLKNNGKSPRLIYAGKDEIHKPNLVLLVEKLEIPIEFVTDLIPPQALVTVDCIYGNGNVTKFAAENIYVIDHHLYNGPKQENIHIRSSYGSCATVVAQLLADENININTNLRIATALYYGLYSDTNGFNELKHPADKDLRDLTVYDEILINILKNSNLSLDEMKIAGDALKHYRYNEKYKFAVVESKPCDPNILGFISDLLLQVDSVDTCIVYNRRQSGIKLSVRSCINDVRANEMTEFIVDGCGSGGGHAQKAGGYINGFADVDFTGFLCDKIIAYYNSFEIVNASDYPFNIAEMKKYTKRKIPLGYVRSTDILPEGEKICVRSLEADLNVLSDKNIYVMIGINGEVYPISKDTFMKTYIDCDLPFNTNTTYSPTVLIKKSCTSVKLLPFARSCIAKRTSTIYAKPLSSTLKIYTNWDSSNYMLGKPGDFIAAHCDNIKDIYIIEQNIFHKTYIECSDK